MAEYEVRATAIASEVYYVTADSEADARAKIERGEWDLWRDLGHEDMEILDVARLDGSSDDL